VQIDGIRQFTATFDCLSVQDGPPASRDLPGSSVQAAILLYKFDRFDLLIFITAFCFIGESLRLYEA